VTIKLIVMDSGVLGLATNPNHTPESLACSQWLYQRLSEGALVFVPEVADYEVRRELIRANKTKGLLRLDALNAALNYVPLTTATMRLAAQLWAQARQKGRPTAPPGALDCDVLLCAQALQIAARPRHAADELVIATTNTRHLQQFVAADEWQNIA
jgi:predicted nucleic acid-binding protein